MSRRASYHIDHRFIIDVSNIETLRGICSPSAKTVYVSRTEGLIVHTLRGVPGAKCDVLLPAFTPSPFIACEIGRKIGSFDSAVRWRIAIRSWNQIWKPAFHDAPSLSHPAHGKISVEECGEELHVISIFKGGMWGQCFPQLRYSVTEGERIGIVLHHWKTYFKFLPGEDVRQLAYLWAELPHTKNCKDIVVLNRTASAALYDLARQLGWRKLTVREKTKLQLDPEGPQWQRADAIERRLTREGERAASSAVGEYTARAANGDREYIRTSHGIVDVE